jgi:hypothetical protein
LRAAALLPFDATVREKQERPSIIHFLRASSAGKLTPSRRLGQEDGRDSEHTTGDELDGKGDEPLLVAVGNSLNDAVVDPETDDCSDLPTSFINSDQSTSDSRGRNFGDVNRLGGSRRV